MKNTIKVLIMFILFNRISYCQDLVVNSDFEFLTIYDLDHSYMDFDPSYLRNYTAAHFWGNITFKQEADYYCNRDVPPFRSTLGQSGLKGRIKAYSGDYYMGLVCYSSNKKNAKIEEKFNNRDMIQTKLIDELKTECLYSVEFYLCLSQESNCAIEDLGVLITKEPTWLESYNDFNNLKPQLYTSPKYINSKEKWTKVTLSYRAQGGEKFITIGNFKPNDAIKFIDSPIIFKGIYGNKKFHKINLEELREWKKLTKRFYKKTERMCYYFIDNVSISPAEKDCSHRLQFNSTNEMGIYKNNHEDYFRKLGKDSLESMYKDVLKRMNIDYPEQN